MNSFFVISVDVEGVPLKDGCMDYSTIVDGVPLLLDLFKEFNVNSTFFVTSDAAQNVAEVMKENAKRGHEIGCHAFGNIEYEKLNEATTIIRKHLNVQPIGFRAHRYEIGSEMLESLSKLDYRYDSSVVSSSRLFNKHFYPKAPKSPYHPSWSNISQKGSFPLLEIPISSLPIVKMPLGLSYVKLFGLNIFKLFLSRMNQRVVTMYLHPYDLVSLPSKVDAPLDFILSQKKKANGLKVLIGLLEFLQKRFSPTYICARDIVDRSASENQKASVLN